MLAICACLFLAGACRSTTTPALAPTATPPSTPVAALPSPTPSPTPIPPGAPQSLTVWVTELVSPLEDDGRARIFEQQILAFEATHPGLTIDVHRKKPEGKGGLEDFLATASAAAPGVVPDLIMIDAGRLPALAQQGLAVPLGGLLDDALIDDMYPFAIQAGSIDGELIGLPFETSIEHALYNMSKIAVPPVSWTEVFSSGATYVFPTLGQDGLVNDAFLIQYLSTGGELLDSNGDPALDQQALSDVLTFYRTGIEVGAILTDVLTYDTVRSGWRKYLQAEVVMTNMTSDLYLEGRGLLKVSKATWIPTHNGQPPVTLARGSAWVLTTRDPNRMPLALQLLSWLVNPNNVATWSLAADRLPTRRAAFEQMPRDDAEYVQFVHAQLEYAIPYPTSEAHARIYRAMQDAVDDVLRAGRPPDVAAADVLAQVGQGSEP
ncbi:MAG: extracellular solute-binding protein [Anaerolineae bacterium]|nr:extracellular solute-binding protein [Anaerolineae bacterium]